MIIYYEMEMLQIRVFLHYYLRQHFANSSLLSYLCMMINKMLVRVLMKAVMISEEVVGYLLIIYLCNFVISFFSFLF